MVGTIANNSNASIIAQGDTEYHGRRSDLLSIVSPGTQGKLRTIPTPAVSSPLRLPRRSGGSPGPGSGRLAGCDRNLAGAGWSPADRERGLDPRRLRSPTRRSCHG